MKANKNGVALIGQPVNAADFGSPRWWRGAGHALESLAVPADAEGVLRPIVDLESGDWQAGIEWDEPRDVLGIVVRFAEGSAIPDDLHVQYWRQNWPTPGPERLPGARRGWIGCDDPWNGHWVTVRAEVEGDGAVRTFTFDPIDAPELQSGVIEEMAKLPSAMRQGLRWYLGRIPEMLEQAQHYLARFRRTLKVRLVGSGDAPGIASLEAYADSTWQELELEVWFHEAGDWRGAVELVNGHLLELSGLGFGADDAAAADPCRSCRVTDDAKGLRLRVLSADCAADSGDRTIVTLRTNERSFSFLTSDLAYGPIYIKDYGVFIRAAGDAISLEEHQEAIARNPKSIYDRVVDEPEQSYERAAAEIPPLDPTKTTPFGRYMPLSVEAGRQEFALRYNAELFASKYALKLRGRDAARLLWPGAELWFRFPTGDPPDFREGAGATKQRVLDGWLPVVISEWLDREIIFEQTAFAALLDGPMTPQTERRGDEDVVAMLRFVIRNGTEGAKRARLWLAISPQEQLELRGNSVVALGRVVPDVPVARQWRVDAYEGPYLRCAVDTGGCGKLLTVPLAREGGSQSINTAVAYDVDLAGGEEHTIYVTVPFVTFRDEQDWERVAALDFGDKLEDVTTYWTSYVGSGGVFEIPTTILNDFHKAAQAHVAIAVDKDPVSGMYMVPAATYNYGVCANEATWQIHMLDQAGHHERAEAYLETYLRTQGTTPLDGDFSSAEGAFLGLEIEDGKVRVSHFNYNLDHGTVMENLVEHYRYTGDPEWLQRVAPHLVDACDMVTRERQATKCLDESGSRVPEYGLMPAGHLEDNPEWRYWFAVDSHAYNGMRGVAEVLADIDHPEAERLAQDAAAFREDIRAAARRAMTESPVVRLLDGTYVPHIPTIAGLRGRFWGWIRETAYGAIHLLEANVFDPCEEEMTWVLKDLEDNLYVSRQYGRPVDLERYWFSHGGITIQPGLTDQAINYLRRGQIEHGLRALFNFFGVALYPDVRVFTEHPVIELGHGVGPFYKTSDEAKALVWLRAFLMREVDDALHLAIGAPRAWFAPGESFGLHRMASFFGPVSFTVVSADVSVTWDVQLDDDRKPEELILHLRLPDGARIKAVTVNGQPHSDVDADAEVVHITNPATALLVRVDYEA